MNTVKIQGVKIDLVDLAQATQQVEEWLKLKTPHTIFTPNLEFLIAAQANPDFKQVLNQGDLNIPDSSHLAWLHQLQTTKSPLQKFLVWLKFPLPNRLIDPDFPVTPGIDLMSQLIAQSTQKGYKIGLLGGSQGLAGKTAKRLEAKYPGLKIAFAADGGQIDQSGQSDTEIKVPALDLLFVGFGQVKQERWIINNLTTQPVKVMMGVGGSLDYLSGQVSRAPQLWRSLGLEWLYRLLLQPWRLKRQLKIVAFVLQQLF